MKVYRYDDYIISQDENTKNSIVAQGYNFYKVDKATFEELFEYDKMEYIRSISDNYCGTIIMVCTILYTMIMYFIIGDFTLINADIIPATLILLFNVFLHEMGHIIFLKLYCKESKIKVGFKFVFIYPAFYVDTSYSYLLPKYKRIAIYLAGNFMNCLFILIVSLGFSEILPYCYLVVSNLLINFIPIVKSDGYYAFITLLNRTNKKLDEKQEAIDDFVRGLVMFVVLSILSII